MNKRDGWSPEKLDMIKTNTGLIYRRISQWKSIDWRSNASVITMKISHKLTALLSNVMLLGNKF